MLQPETWAWIEKVGILTVLMLNLTAILGLGRFIFKQLQERRWVPGWVYAELAQERDYLKVENQALRGVTLRAIRVTANAVGLETAP